MSGMMRLMSHLICENCFKLFYVLDSYAREIYSVFEGTSSCFLRLSWGARRLNQIFIRCPKSSMTMGNGVIGNWIICRHGSSRFLFLTAVSDATTPFFSE